MEKSFVDQVMEMMKGEDKKEAQDLRRLQIAAMALQGVIMNRTDFEMYEDRAKHAVKFADALIAELDKPKEEG